MSILDRDPAPANPDPPAADAGSPAAAFRWLVQIDPATHIIAIGVMAYSVREVYYEESDGTLRMIVRLRKPEPAKTEYRLTPNADGDFCCDCPDAIYRERPTKCKHAVAIRRLYEALNRGDRGDRGEIVFRAAWPKRDGETEPADAHIPCPTCNNYESRYCPTCDGIGEISRPHEPPADCPLCGELLNGEEHVHGRCADHEQFLADADAVLDESARTGNACGIVRREGGAS